MSTLPEYMPGEGHDKGALVQKFNHEVSVDFFTSIFI